MWVGLLCVVTSLSQWGLHDASQRPLPGRCGHRTEYPQSVCAVLPGGSPWERSSEAQRPQPVSLETTPVQTQREPVPRPEPGLSSRRQEEGDREGVRAGTEEATLAAGVGPVRAVWASDEVPAPPCSLLSSPPLRVALLCPGSSN